MAVTWRTAADGPGPYVVEWRSAPDGPSDGASTGRAAATSEPAPGGRGVLHKAELAGLEPDTSYVYRVAGDGGAWGEERSFRTAPASLPPEGIAFTMHADVGTSYMFADVGPIMRQLAREPFGPHLVVGDLTYADPYRGTEEEEHWLANDLALVAGHRPVLVTWGNHEYAEAADVGIGTIVRYFQLPRTGLPNACNPAPSYPTRYAGILLVALDDPASPCFDGVAQQAWLARTLAASAGDPSIAWRVVLVHRPPFSSGCHGGEPLHRLPELDRYGVDLVLSGHDHDYERSWPVRWDGGDVETDYAAPRYPTYVVAGIGGSRTYDCGAPSPWTAFFDPGRYVGYLRVTARPWVLRVELVAMEAYLADSPFGIVDAVSITK